MTDTPNKPVKFLDLDALTSENEITIKLNGTVHKLQPLTVGDFINNTKLIQQLGTAADMETEIEAILTLLLRTFPTMKREELVNLPVQSLNAILEFANEHNGQNDAKRKTEEASNAIPPQAG